MYVDEIVIVPPENALESSKGDFFEDLLGRVMRTQRYEVVKRINFTGTEIDLLCKHQDRPDDTALVECKARRSINATDVKTFVYDVHEEHRAGYGFFVHTTELQHQAAGLVQGWKDRGVADLVAWGPSKVAELLVHAGHITPPDDTGTNAGGMMVTKTLLVFAESGRFWVQLLASGNVPEYFRVLSAATGSEADEQESLRIAEYVGEISQNMRPLPHASAMVLTETPSLETVAEVQECEQWDDYRPASSMYFVGRKDVRGALYQFVLSPLTGTSSRRVFYLEGKSGWGKSSIIVDLRSRARNARNRNKLFVYAVDCRSAASSAFPALAFARMVEQAVESGFLPGKFASVTLSSPMAILQSDGVQALLDWLQNERKVAVLVFDQFEDIFRRADLFKCFYQLMVDGNARRGNFVVGFSWKSEIHIPIDNPAYNLWQLAREQAESFGVEEFDSAEVNGVIRQLEAESHEKLPMDLRRRLVEISQGFPWLIKKLAIHCYREFGKGVTPEQLVDQDLNVELLFRNDMEGLNSEQTRGLKYVAKRAFDGDAFDVTEVDDTVPTEVIDSLRDTRLIIRSGSKYNAYWDIFQEYLVTGEVPPIGESFIFRQYPKPCMDLLEIIFALEDVKRVKVSVVRRLSELMHGVSEGTILNRLRELRHLGLVMKEGDEFVVRPGITSEKQSLDHVARRLDTHIVVSDLRRSGCQTISRRVVKEALERRYPTYRYASRTWVTYAGYLMAWMRVTKIDLGGRLMDIGGKGQTPETFTPQLRPEKVVTGFLALHFEDGVATRTPDRYKLEYDLKSLGLVTYSGSQLFLTRRGRECCDLEADQVRTRIAQYAAETLKIRRAAEVIANSPRLPRHHFANRIEHLLREIKSSMYRRKTITVLKSWGEFVNKHYDVTQGGSASRPDR